MKELILIIAFFFSITGCGENRQYSETEKVAQVVRLDSSLLVKEINEYKIKVDSIKTFLDSIHRDIYESTEGGIVKSFYNGIDTLKKEAVYYGEMGKRILNKYQKKGNSVLIEDILINYAEPISVSKDVEISSTNKNVYYLDSNQSLIHWIEDNLIIPSSKYEAKEKEIKKL